MHDLCLFECLNIDLPLWRPFLNTNPIACTDLLGTKISPLSTLLLQRLSYAKTKSDATAKVDGTLKEHLKDRKKGDSAAARGTLSYSLHRLFLTRI